MIIIGPSRRGGGGGNNFVLVSGSPFTTVAALETWSQANPTLLFNNASQISTAFVGTSLYQYRGTTGVYVSGQWSDESPVGLTPEQMAAVDSITDLSLGDVPMKGSNGLVPSLAEQDGNTALRIDGSVISTKDTIEIGQGVEVSEDAGLVKVVDNIDNMSFLPALTQLNTDGTTGNNFVLRRFNRQSVPLQPAQTETRTGNWSAHLPVTSTRIIKRITSRFAQAATGIRLTLRAASSSSDTTGIILFQSHTDSVWNAGGGYSVPASPLNTPVDFGIDIDNSAKVIQGSLIYAVLEQNTQGTGEIELRGVTTTIGGINQFYAYLVEDAVQEERKTNFLFDDIRETDSQSTNISITSANVADYQPFSMLELTNNTGIANVTVAEDVFTAGDNLIVSHYSTSGSRGARARFIQQGSGGTTINIPNDSAKIIKYMGSNVWRVVSEFNPRGQRDSDLLASITSFGIANQATSVLAGTTISGTKTFNLNINHPEDVAGSMFISQDGATLSSSVASTATSIDLPITSVTLQDNQHTTFELSGITDEGQTLIKSFTIRAHSAAESLFYGLSSSNNASTVLTSGLTSTEAGVDGTKISTGTTTAGQYFIILTPSNHDITSIIDFVEQPVRAAFTRTANVRTIGTTSYNAYVIGPLNAGGSESYTLRF